MSQTPQTPGAGGNNHNANPGMPPLSHHNTTDHQAKYGRAQNLLYHQEGTEREPPKRLRELFSKPTIRQVCTGFCFGGDQERGAEQGRRRVDGASPQSPGLASPNLAHDSWR